MSAQRPLAVDLYTGLHGWAEGLIAAGFYVVGVDIVDMSKTLGVPKPEHFSLIVQDVLTFHGSQIKHARLIVGSSPCTKYSYMAMPWTRAKALAAYYRDPEHPERLDELNALYDAQFRIQREASEAAGRHIPLVVENVRGAQPWVGRARASFGSYYLWGDVPALMPQTVARKVAGFRFDGSGGSFQTAAVEHTKNTGGSWFNVGSPGQKQTGCNPVAGKANNPARGVAIGEARKVGGDNFFANGSEWMIARSGPGTLARKAASAKIAKIPLTLSTWIGKCHYPQAVEREGEWNKSCAVADAAR